MSTEPNTPLQRGEWRPVDLLLTAATAIVGGAVIGGSTNAINAVVSPLYFRNIMQWQDVEDIWRASVAQGIFEGLLYGILYSVVFTFMVGLMSRERCPFKFAFRQMLVILLAIYVCWAIGGLMAMGLATLSPEFFRKAFIGVPDEFVSMLRYAWVGGSIWGAMFGGLLAVVISSASFVVRSRGFPHQAAG